MSAVAKFQSEHVRPAKGRTLVVGSRVYETRSDRRLLFADAVGVDMVPAPGVDIVADLEENHPEFGLFRHIDCVSVLEHSRRPWLLAISIEDMMEIGATLYVQVPLIWGVHRPPDYWRMTTDAVRSIFPRISWQRLAYAHTEVADGGKTPSIVHDDYRYIARTEVCGFGVRQ